MAQKRSAWPRDGYLPRIYQAARPARMLDAYIADYLEEEIAAVWPDFASTASSDRPRSTTRSSSRNR